MIPTVLGLHDGIPWHKVPLLLTVAWFTRASTTSPNPVASAEDQTRFAKGLGKKDVKIRTYGSNPMKYVAGSVLVGEAALITASAVLSPERLHAWIPALASVDVRELSPSPLFYLGCGLVCTGASIRLICFRQLGRFFTFQLAVKKDHQLITEGLYSVVRHPAYFGSLMLDFGLVLALLSRGSWIAREGLLSASTSVGWGAKTVAAYFVCYTALHILFAVRRTYREDIVLHKEFGEQWEAWAKKTPYKLIPYIY